MSCSEVLIIVLLVITITAIAVMIDTLYPRRKVETLIIEKKKVIPEHWNSKVGWFGVMLPEAYELTVKIGKKVVRCHVEKDLYDSLNEGMSVEIEYLRGRILRNYIKIVKVGGMESLHLNFKL